MRLINTKINCISALLVMTMCTASPAHSKPIADLFGQWNFQTVTGSENGKDVISSGVMKIMPKNPGDTSSLVATIVWLDEKGIARNSREMEGTLDHGDAVFTHKSVRTSSSSNGKNINTQGEVIWTMHAQANALNGTRAFKPLEADADDAKPVTAIRSKSSTMPIVVALPPPPPERGAATPEERARVMQMATDSEREPQQVYATEHAWLQQWVEEVPDFIFNFKGPTISWLKSASNQECRDILGFQFMASAMAFQITHPTQVDDNAAIDLAGLEGALRAYKKLISSNPALRSAKLEQALVLHNKGDKGEMAKFLFALSGRDSETSALSLVIPAAALVQDANVQRIITMAKTDPQVMQHLDVIGNRFGGRMIGSDAYTHAANWAKNQLGAWGLQTQLEAAGKMPVGFNRGPSSGRVSSGNAAIETLRFGTPAYTSGTKGVQTGAAMIAPATLAELEQRKTEFKGTWVLLTQESSGTGRDGEYQYKPSAFTKKLMSIGVLGTIQSAAEPLSIASAAPTTWENLPTLPDIKLAASQFEAIKATVKKGQQVRLEFDIRNWFYPGPVPYHNVVAKIPGTQMTEEIILLGAHLDSYDGGTGAADNGAGFSTVMEAMRLLAQAGVKPRRSIVMVGFAGEELGLKGAYAYTERHASELKQIVMMLNRDSAPAALIGITIPSAWKAPFERVSQDLQGVHPIFEFTVNINDSARDSSTALGGNVGSDDAVFSHNRIPTPRFTRSTDFDYQQVHHTALDTYEKVLPFRTLQEYAAIVLALSAYEAANAPESLRTGNYYRAEAVAD